MSEGSHSERVFGLDLVRCCAILSVLLLHLGITSRGLPELLLVPSRYGWAGVDLFFVLSGFLIADQTRGLLLRSPDLPLPRKILQFWTRRWTRTLPLYFLVLAVYAIVKPWIFHAPFVGWNWKYLFFLQNTGPMRDFVQSWSLCIEEQFYFFFPLLFFPLLRARKWPWLLPLAASLALRARAALDPAVHFPTLSAADFDALFRFPFTLHLDGISLGVFLAMTKETWEAWDPRIHRVFAGAGLGLILGTCASFGPAPGAWGSVLYFFFLALGFAGTIIGAYSLKSAPRGSGWITKVSLWSYGAYLWNNLLMRVLERHPLPHWSLEALAFFGGTFAISALTYRFVEKPGMRLRRLL